MNCSSLRPSFVKIGRSLAIPGYNSPDSFVLFGEQTIPGRKLEILIYVLVITRMKGRKYWL